MVTRGNLVQLRIKGWDSPGLAFCNPNTSLTIDGCAKTLEDLQTLLYITEHQKGFTVGTCIHGDACRATILKCVSRAKSSHPSMGQGGEVNEGGSRHKEIH